MRRSIIALWSVIAGLLVLAGSVAAHSDLVAAEPAPGAQLAESPAEIRLTFSEPVAATSQIVLMAENFEPVEGLVPQFNAARPDQVYAPLPELAPGLYTVQWIAASDDGHEISGSYSFGVGLVTPGAPGSGETGITASQTGVGMSNAWLLALIGVAVLIPLALVMVRRGRRVATPPSETGE